MYEEIKRLAVEAVKLQNKLNMEATLNTIAALCDADLSSASAASGDESIAAGDVLVAADGQEFKVDAVVSDAPAAPKKTRAKVAK